MVRLENIVGLSPHSFCVAGSPGLLYYVVNELGNEHGQQFALSVQRCRLRSVHAIKEIGTQHRPADAPQRSDFISIINFFSLHHTTTSPDVRVGPAVTSEPQQRLHLQAVTSEPQRYQCTTTSPDVRVGPAVTSEPKLSDASYAFPSNLSQLQFHRLGNQ